MTVTHKKKHIHKHACNKKKKHAHESIKSHELLEKIVGGHAGSLGHCHGYSHQTQVTEVTAGSRDSQVTNKSTSVMVRQVHFRL